MNREQERSRKYGCDGHCYTTSCMCPAAEICPETRAKEFISTIAAVLIIFFTPIIVIVAIIMGIMFFNS